MSSDLISDETLGAYLDGALDDASSEVVAKALETDLDLMARLANLSALNDELGSAFQSPIEEGVPDRFLRSLAAYEVERAQAQPDLEPNKKVIDFNVHAAQRAEAAAKAQLETSSTPVNRFPHLWKSASAAAAVLLLLFFGGSYLIQPSAPLEMQDGMVQPSQSLAMALATAPSLTTVKLRGGAEVKPVLTFASGEGKTCRQFVLSQASQDTAAVACYSEDRWHIESLTRHTPSASGLQSGYVTASGDDEPVIDATLARLKAQPMDGGAEALALAKLR